MTTYQGRLKQRANVDAKLLLIAMIAAVIVILCQVAYTTHLRMQINSTNVGLITCNEFLSDLEESEVFK